MDTIYSFDQQLFLLINHLPHNLIFDSLAQGFSGIGRYGLIWFLLGILIFFREEKRDHRFYLLFLATALLASVIPHLLLKPLFGRLRPVWLPEALVFVPVNDYSFPSGHATFSFTMATLLSAYEPGWKTGLYTLAILISFSRIYLGVHYPLDVIAGGILGTLIGYTSFYLTRRFIRVEPGAKTRGPARSGKPRKR